LYSDKILAVLREYGSNAWDAHRDAGKHDLPIKVTLPTAMDPTLTIRDFGLGLSPGGVFNVFTQYGASTKRDSDDSVGCLGVGSKSGFAYSDSFTITSRQCGEKRTYVAVLDESEKGRIDLLHTEPCDEEDTGVAISIAVRVEDIGAFERKARALYKYFVPRPEINTELPQLPPEQASFEHGVVYDTISGVEAQWVAVMGCVSYHIDLGQLRGSDATPEGGVAMFLLNISGALYFDIGEVHVSASREELKYSAETKLALVRKFNALIEEYVRDSLTRLRTGASTPWERRVRAQTFARLSLPVPKDAENWLSPYVNLDGHVPEGIAVVHNRARLSRFAVRADTRLVIVDDVRALAGFSFRNEVFVRAVNKAGQYSTARISWADVEAKVAALCDAAGITGIPVVRLSSLPWQAPVRDASGKKNNAKHRRNHFKLIPDRRYASAKSDAWEAVSRVPSADDVFVLLEGFQSTGFNFKLAYAEDLSLAEYFGKSLPDVYGYKTTAAKPVRDGDCVGTPYHAWRETWLRSMLSQRVRDACALVQWRDVFQDSENYWRVGAPGKKGAARLISEFGPGHVLTQLFEKHCEGWAYFEVHREQPDALHVIGRRVSELSARSGDAAKVLETVYQKYPLLGVEGHSITSLWSSRASEWIKYVKLVDKG
jgi:hypothetical protein